MSGFAQTVKVAGRHARAALEDWKHDYYTVRPDSGLGNLPPAL
jgi:transposase InsO family protein